VIRGRIQRNRKGQCKCGREKVLEQDTERVPRCFFLGVVAGKNRCLKKGRPLPATHEVSAKDGEAGQGKSIKLLRTKWGHILG